MCANLQKNFCPVSPQNPKNMLHALLIGIDNYPPPLPPLKGCGNDIAIMQNLLNTLQTIGSQDFVKNIVVLTNEGATKQAIITAIKTTFATAKADDILLFYFSGHGARERAERAVWQTDYLEGFVCYDSKTKGLLSDKEFRYLMYPYFNIVKHSVVITDCCHAGSITRSDLKPRLAASFPERQYSNFVFSDKINKKDCSNTPISTLFLIGKHLHIAACEADKLAYETNGNGQLTLQLIQNLRAANGQISYALLAQRLRASLIPTGQTPAIDALGGADAQLNLNFLTATTLRESGAISLAYFADKGWTLATGAIDARINKENKNNLYFAVHSDAGECATDLEVTKLLPTETWVTPTNTAVLDVKKMYKVFVADNFAPIRIALIGAPISFAKLQDYIKTKPTTLTDLNIIWTSEAKADYFLTATSSAKGILYNIARSETPNLPICKAIISGECMVFDTIRCVQKWRAAKQLSNPISEWTNGLPLNIDLLQYDQQRQLIHTAPIAETSSLTAKTLLNGKKGAYFSIKIMNKDTRPMYVAVVGLTDLYGIATDLLPVTKLEQQGDSVQPLEGISVPLTAENYAIDFALPAVSNYLLVIASTRSFTTNDLKQADLPPPEKYKPSPPVMRGNAVLGRALLQKAAKDDWNTQVYELQLLLK